MRIHGWHVEGFGIFHDFHVDNLSAGLVLLYGPNEAGKSTLLAFLRSILFGFPDRRSNHPQYPPLQGGRHGGSVFLAAQDGVYRIERINGRRSAGAIVRPDGSEGAATELQTLLAGADQTLFRSVFAFSLYELTELESLSSEGVRARIFSAGIAGAGRSAREVVDALDRDAGELLTPRGGRIRELITNIQDVQEQIERARELAKGYPALLQHESRALTEVDRLRRHVSECETTRHRLEKLIALWPIQSEFQRRRAELENLPAITTFPLDPELRLASTLDGRERASGEAAANRLQFSSWEQARKRLQLNDVLLSVRAEIQSLSAELELQRSRLHQIAKERVALSTADETVTIAIRDLGPGWTEARLASFDSSLPSVEEVRDWQRRLTQSNEESAIALSQLGEQENHERAVEETLQRLMADLQEAGGAAGAERVAALRREIEVATQLVGPTSPVSSLDVPSFAADVELVRDLEREHDQLAALDGEATRSRNQIIVDTSLDLVHPQIDRVYDHVGSQRERIRQVDGLLRSHADAQAAVDSALRELGAGWNAERTRAFPVSLTVSQRVRELSNAIDTTGHETEGARGDLDTVAQGRSGRQKDLERLRRTFEGTEPPTRSVLTEQSLAIRRLRVHLAELGDIRAQILAEEQLLTDRAQTLAHTATQATLPTWLTPTILLVVLASLVGALWRFSAGDIFGGSALAGVALVVLVSLVALRRRDASVAATMARRAQDLRASLAEIERVLSDLRRRATELRESIALDARVLELPDPPSLTHPIAPWC